MPQPPLARRDPVRQVVHGREVVDEYAWMLDTTSAEVREHLVAEQRYAAAELASLAGLRGRVRAELDARHVDAPVSPTAHGGWWYFTRRPPGADHRQYLRRRIDPGGADGAVPLGADLERGAEVILDGEDIRRRLGGFALGAFRPSPDHTMLAFGIDTEGDERFTTLIRDLRTGELLDDRLTGCHYTCAWSADGTRLLYTTGDALNRPHRVWLHVVGTAQDDDALLHEDPDPAAWLTLSATRSGTFVDVRAAVGSVTEHRLLRADDPTTPAVLVLSRDAGVYYEVDHRRAADGRDLLYLLNNRSGPEFEVARAPLDAPGAWETVVPHHPDRRLHWVLAFRDQVVVHAREGSTTGFLVLGPQDERRTVGFEPGVLVTPASNPDFGSAALRVSRTSPVLPPSVESVDLTTGRSVVVERMPVGPAPDGRPFDPREYRAHTLTATAPDGVAIPVTLVERADAVGPGPCVLYAYGAYERVADMTFSVNRLALLDRGYRYAVAHVRGGGELGKWWHEGGRRSRKPTSVSDYLAVLRHLVDQGWAAPGQVVGRSSSAGGLVVGAALNAAPGELGAVVLTAPFLDPLTSLLDPSRPLTVPEWDELGNPLEDPAAFDTIRGYSPYENVGAGPYPPVLVVSGMRDARVSVAEPARWVARLRARATGGPFVLLPEERTGHSGARGRGQVLDRDALVTAWILRTVPPPVDVPA